MNARMKRHRFGVSYKGDSKFPYTTEQIALVLNYLDNILKEEDYGASTPVKEKEANGAKVIDMPIFSVIKEEPKAAITACGISAGEAKNWAKE